MREYAVLAVRTAPLLPCSLGSPGGHSGSYPPRGYSVASTKFLEALRMCRLSRLLRSCTTKAQTTCGS